MCSIETSTKNGRITSNVANDLDAPESHTKESRAATVEEQRAIMQALKTNKFGTSYLLCIQV